MSLEQGAKPARFDPSRNKSVSALTAHWPIFVYMSDFRKLIVWRKAHALMLKTVKTAPDIHGIEFLSLRSQIVRAAMSIPANIVEGRAQPSDALFKRHISTAIGSATELEYHFIAARDAGCLAEEKANSLGKKAVEVRKMLIGLRKKLEK